MYKMLSASLDSILTPDLESLNQQVQGRSVGGGYRDMSPPPQGDKGLSPPPWLLRSLVFVLNVMTFEGKMR